MQLEFRIFQCDAKYLDWFHSFLRLGGHTNNIQHNSFVGDWGPFKTILFQAKEKIEAWSPPLRHQE